MNGRRRLPGVYVYTQRRLVFYEGAFPVFSFSAGFFYIYFDWDLEQ